MSVQMAADGANSSPLRTVRVMNWGLTLLIAAALVLKLRLVFLLNVNWDEFFYLSHVHQYLRGELTAQFQVFHVHLFWWLPRVAGDEISQITAARLVMYGLAVGSAGLTYLIARRFLSATGALFAVLAYLSVSNVIEHGTSFRADPIAAFLFLAALCLLLYRSGCWRAAGGAGLLMALAAMVTIKAALHLAVLGALLAAMLMLADRRRRMWAQTVAFGLAFVAGLALLYEWHRLTLPVTESIDAAGFAVGTADKMFTNGLLLRWRELIVHLVRNPVVWGLMISGVVLVSVDAIRGRKGALGHLLIFGAFWIPVLSVLAYRNAFPYFYVFILSPAVVVSGIVIDRLVQMVQENRSRLALAEIATFVGVTAVSLALHYQTNAVDATRAGRQVVDVIHRMFPQPVPYIDGPSMIATFPQTGFFMSTWGMETYRAAKRPVLAEAIARQAPVFVLADMPALADAMSGTHRVPPDYALLEADRAALTENYVHHWGRVYVAGKRLEFDGPKPVRFEILIPGTYTVETADPIMIDDAPYAPGQPVRLAAGSHVLTPDSAAGAVTLRWGDRLFRPTEAPSPEPLFLPFR
ncbi:MAG: hypothetical protein AB7E71_20075 [Dongiaceae bacterium]